VWIGYDQPKSLGDRETGGGLSLPVWISFMETALKGVPVMEPSPPEGVINVGGEWYYEEYARGSGVGSLGMSNGAEPGGTPPAVRGPSGEQAPGGPVDRSLQNSDGLPPNQPRPQNEERRSILDLFRN
jgi:penicillin-binding protein 1A